MNLSTKESSFGNSLETNRKSNCYEHRKKDFLWHFIVLAREMLLSFISFPVT